MPFNKETKPIHVFLKSIRAKWNPNTLTLCEYIEYIIRDLTRAFLQANSSDFIGLVMGSIPSRIIPNTLKIILETSLLNTRHYKVRIKGKVEQSRERSSALPKTSVL